MPTDNLPASAFRAGDRVLGTDEGGTYFGTVSEHQCARYADAGEVLVYWSQEEYDSGSLGHIAPPELLRLWPSSAHTHRLATYRLALIDPAGREVAAKVDE